MQLLPYFILNRAERAFNAKPAIWLILSLVAMIAAAAWIFYDITKQCEGGIL